MTGRLALATASSLIIIGCSNEKTSRPVANHAPRVDSLRIAPSLVMSGDTVSVRAYATDEDRDSLHFVFAATGGGFLGQSRNASTWVAPDTASSCTLSVEVSDGRATGAADTMVAVYDAAPLTLAFSDLFAFSGDDTLRAGGSAAPDTFPFGSTFRARWTAASGASVAKIDYEWRGTYGEFPGGTREFESAVNFSGPAVLSLQAVGSAGQAGNRLSYRFVGNFDPHASFLRDGEGRRLFLADGEAHAEGDTLAHHTGGYTIRTCVTGADRDGRVMGYQYVFGSRGVYDWSVPTPDSCFQATRVDDGDYTIGVRAIDDAGRTGPKDEFRLYVNLAPRFFPSDAASGFTQRPQPGDTLSVTEANPLGIRFWATDSDGRVMYYRYRLDSHAWSRPVEPSPGPAPGLPAGSLSASVSQISRGVHRISVVAFDDGGREKMIVVPFTVIL